MQTRTTLPISTEVHADMAEDGRPSVTLLDDEFEYELVMWPATAIDLAVALIRTAGGAGPDVDAATDAIAQLGL